MNESNRAPIFISIVIVLLVAVRLISGLDPVARAYDGILNPITSRINKLTVGNEVVTGGSPAELELKQLKEENRLLRDQLSFAGDLPYETIAADVMRKRTNGPRKYVSINRGSSDGLKIGDSVLSAGVLVGVVSSVNRGSSDVQLVTDAQFRATARAVDSSAQGVVTNQYGSTSFNLVPRELSEGSVIETDGSDEVFPPGLAIGKTGSLVASNNSVFNRYVLVLPINPGQLDTVIIIVGEDF